MRIAFLGPVGALGGAEWILLDLLAVLRVTRPDWPLHLIAGGDGPLLEAASKLGVETHMLPIPPTLSGLGDSSLGTGQVGRTKRMFSTARKAGAALTELPGFVRRLSRLLKSIDPQLVHSNGLKCHLIANHALPRDVPVVWHIHDFLSSRIVVGKALRRLTRRPQLAIAISHAVAQDTSQTLPGLRVETVYNGIDTDAFTPAGPVCETLDSLAGMPAASPGTIRVGLVATYARWKGQDVFIDAMERLAKRGDLPPFRSVIVGGPVYQTAGSQFSEAELRGRIRDRGLGEFVGLVPFQRNLPPVYRALDVVVHASTKPEPFGRTIVEAMACGRAVVVSNAGGAAELFQQGVDAIGVPPGDASALAETIATLLSDPQRRHALGQAARTSAVARFSRGRMGESILSLYESLEKAR